MQISKSKVTKRETCKRCHGAGSGTWVVDHGRCFACAGTGQVAVAFEGTDVKVGGYVARPVQIERGTVKVSEILIVTEETPAARKAKATLSRSACGFS